MASGREPELTPRERDQVLKIGGVLLGLGGLVLGSTLLLVVLGSGESYDTEQRPPEPRRARVRAGEFLYAVSTLDDGFYKIDPRTGAAVSIGKTGMGGGVEDIAFDPDGRVLGVCWDGEPRLFRIDLNTGQGRKGAAIQGKTIPYKVVEGLTAIGGTLYGSASAADSYCGDCANHLIKIEPATGRAVEVGAFGPEFLNVEALAYSPKYGLIGADIGTLIAPDFQKFHTRPALVKIDPATGKATKIGDLPPRTVRLVGNTVNKILSPQGPFLSGLDFGPDGTLYAATLPTHFGGDSVLLSVDPETAEITELGPTGAKHLDGLLYFSPLKLSTPATGRPE